jgi:hypothetical protein
MTSTILLVAVELIEPRDSFILVSYKQTLQQNNARTFVVLYFGI